MPKNNNIWIFGSMQGIKYLDNARYLFEYVHKSTSIDAIWISKNKTIIENLQKKGYAAYWEYSIKGIIYASRAKVAVITHRGNRNQADLPFYLMNNKTLIIQLWHGIGLKKMAYDDNIFSFKRNEKALIWKLKSVIQNTFLPYLEYLHKPSVVTVLAENTQIIFAKALRLDIQNIYISGYPRNDILLHKSFFQDKRTIQKLIYMPTFRGLANSNFDLFTQYQFNVKILDTFLSDMDMELSIKLHSYNKLSHHLSQEIAQAKNIHLLKNEDVYEILADYDVLLTDYSSVYFDFLLLDKPIIFTPFDKNEYLKKEREFYFDYDEVTPGPHASDWNEVMHHILFYKNSPEAYSLPRNVLKKKFHTFTDIHSRNRIYEIINERLNSQ